MRLWRLALALVLAPLGVVAGVALWLATHPRVEVTTRAHEVGNPWEIVQSRETSRLTGHERTLVGLCAVGDVPTMDSTFFIIDRPQFVDFVVHIEGSNKIRFWLLGRTDARNVATKPSVELPLSGGTIETELLPGPPNATAQR